MASLQRTNQPGSMVPNRQIRGAILPWEKQLIDTLGLTIEEYNWYANEVANYRPERDAAYDIVPHVVCDPLTVGIVTTVVGVGLNFAAQALAPKPKLPKRSDPAQQQGGSDVTGASVSADNRFTNVDGFTSVQPLARLGEVMPLVFANRGAYGGVRVETKLLWSQLLSQGDGQELLAIFLAGAGVLAAIPSIKGFAIGDSLIRGYQENKFAVYSKRGVAGEGRLTTANLVAGQLAARGTDVFLADYSNAGMQPLFSGVRIPTTMTQFGASEPLRNAQDWRLPYKRVRVSFPPFVNPGTGGDVAGALQQWQKETEAARKANNERDKIESHYASRTGIMKVDGATHSTGWQDVNVSIGSVIEFWMYGGNIPNTFGEFGVQDIATKDDNYRISCDEVLIPGETYLIHEVEAVCTGSYPATTIWSPTAPKAYFFKALTAGKVRRASEQIIIHAPDFNSRNLAQYVNPCNGATLLKLAVANITTTRKLNQVEIGIKSQVWKRFNGMSNFSSQPAETTLAAIEAGGNNYIVGQYSEYGLRYSFFRLQIREKGTEAWITLEDSAGPFCVRGRTPVDQFNFIRIKFPRDDVQYEIRLRPLAGGSILNVSTGISTRVLDARSGGLEKYGVYINNGGFEISYKGSTEVITQSMGTNSVMFFGGKAEAGAVESLGAVDYLTNGEQELATFATTTISGPGSGLTVSVTATETSSTQKFTAIAKPGSNDSFSMKWLHDELRGVNNNGRPPGTPTGLGQRFKGRITYSYAPVGVDPDPFMQIEVELDLTSASTTDFGALQGYPAGGFMWSCSAIPGARITVTGNSKDPMTSGQYAYKKPAGVAMPPSGFEYSLLNLTTSEQVIYTAYVIPANRGSGYKEGSKVRVQGIGIYLDDLTVQEVVDTTQGQSVAENYDAVADVYLYDQQEGSHQNGPEHQVVYVNEQRQNDSTPIYDNMALIGLQLRSGKEWNDFNNFTYYAKQGINVTRMVDPTSGNTSGYSPTSSITGPTHLFPEILRHLLRAPAAGAANLIPEDMIDWPGFQAACKLCIQNDLFYDGVIGSPVNVRDWAYEHAPYFFLDFLILGGKISLQPTFPVAANQLTGYSIYGAYNRLPKISALFTDGNIVEDSLQVSWYPTEQRIAPQVLVTVRDEVEDGFAETRNILVRPNDPNHRSLQVEAVDFTGFCTNATHAISFAKLLIQTRRYVTHTITFKTFPESLALAPGAYFKVASQARHVDQFQNGYVLNDGKVVSSTGLSGSNSVYWWRSGLTEVQTGTMTVDANGFTSALFAGAVFTVYSNSQSAYCYKAELISYDEEGMVEITGTHVPVDSSGRITYLNLEDSQFVVENEQ
mgnify:FL=1